jgi:hypothetical protein
MVAVILIVAKLLSVAPHPHTDFGYLGFSFFFVHIFEKMPLVYPVFFSFPDDCIYNLIYPVFYLFPYSVSL